MTGDELHQIIRDLADGTARPRRVVYCSAGLASSPERALRDHGVVPQLCFVRNDGWTLGTPVAFVTAAFASWPDMWVAAVPLPNHPLLRRSNN